MDLLGKLRIGFTIGCTVYTTWKLFKNINIRKDKEDVLQQPANDKYGLKIITSNEMPPCDCQNNSLEDTNANVFNNDKLEYFNVITIDNEYYKSRFSGLQTVVEEHTTSINDLKSIIKEQQKCIKEQTLINSELLLKLNEKKTEEKNTLDLVDKKRLIEYCTRTNKRLNGIVRKMPSLKSVRVTKNGFKKLKNNYVKANKHITSTQIMQKKQFDEKISKIIRKYDKLKTKDMMSMYTMGTANASTARSEFNPPEMNARNPSNNSFAYPMPVDIATPSVKAIPKIPVPPPMPSTSSASAGNPSPQASVAPPVPPVPPVPPTPPALPAEIPPDTKNLLKVKTPVSDTVKKPQCVIDARNADATVAAASDSSAVAVVADTTVTVRSGPPLLLGTPEIMNILWQQMSTDVPEFEELIVNVSENSLWDDSDQDETDHGAIVLEEPNIPLPEIPKIRRDVAIVDEQITSAVAAESSSARTESTVNQMPYPDIN